MKLGSIVAIYALFWSLCAFLVLPFGVRTHEEAGAPLVPGQADSAPHVFALRKVLWRTTWLSAALFAAYYGVYTSGWIDPATFDFAKGH